MVAVVLTAAHRCVIRRQLRTRRNFVDGVARSLTRRARRRRERGRRRRHVAASSSKVALISTSRRTSFARLTRPRWLLRAPPRAAPASRPTSARPRSGLALDQNFGPLALQPARARAVAHRLQRAIQSTSGSQWAAALRLLETMPEAGPRADGVLVQPGADGVHARRPVAERDRALRDGGGARRRDVLDGDRRTQQARRRGQGARDAARDAGGRRAAERVLVRDDDLGGRRRRPLARRALAAERDAARRRPRNSYCYNAALAALDRDGRRRRR